MTGPKLTCPICRVEIHLGSDRWLQMQIDGRYRTVHAECAAQLPERATLDQAGKP